MSAYKVPVNRLEWNLNFLDRFSENTKVSNFIKIRPVTAELFYAGPQRYRWTDMTKLIVCSLYFASGPKNDSTESDRELACYKIITEFRCFSRTEGDTDCALVVVKVRERLTASKRVVYKYKISANLISKIYVRAKIYKCQ
jgi:hypothetical protein